jgi:hypothetical protein
MAGSDIFLYGSRLHAHMGIKKGLIDFAVKFKQEIYAGILIFVFAEFSLFWFLPLISCLNRCISKWWHGFYHIIPSFPYVIIFGIAAFFLFRHITRKTGPAFFYVTKEKFTLFFFIYALSAAVTRAIIWHTRYVGPVTTSSIGGRLILILHYPYLTILRILMLLIVAPILEYLLSCYIVSRFIKKI